MSVYAGVDASYMYYMWLLNADKTFNLSLLTGLVFKGQCNETLFSSIFSPNATTSWNSHL